MEDAGDGRYERGKPAGRMGPQPPTRRVANSAWQSCRRKGFLGSGLPCCPDHHGRRVPPLDLTLRTALHHSPGLLGCVLSGAPGPISSGLGHWISSMHGSASQPYAAWLHSVSFRAAWTVWTCVRVCSLHLQGPVGLCAVVALPFVSLRLSSVSPVLRDCRTTVCVRLVASPGIGHGPWPHIPGLCQQMARYHDTAAASRGLCRRCLVAVDICTASGMGGNSLSAVPRPAVLGQHPLPARHVCRVASLRCAFSWPGPAPCITAALTPTLCYFGLSL